MHIEVGIYLLQKTYGRRTAGKVFLIQIKFESDLRSVG